MRRAYFFWALLLTAVSFPTSVEAILITNSTTNTVLFSDDFENQTAGAAQTSANMNPGAAGSSWSNVGSNQRVVETATVPVPGAYQGTKYLRADRSGGGNGASGAGNANFTAAAAGETIEISFAYNLTLGSLAFHALGAGNSIIWNSQPTGAGGLWEFYDSSGMLNATTTTLTVGAVGSWHMATYSYLQGSTDLTLTIDGVPETIVGAISASDASKFLSAASFRVNSGSTVFYDAVPEPSSIALLGCGIAMAAIGIRKRLGRRGVRATG